MLHKGECPLYVTSNQRVRFKIYWDEVQSCFVCEIIQLFFVVFYVVRFVHKFGFRSDIKGEKCEGVSETRVSERVFMYSPPPPECYGILPTACRSTELS